MATRILHLAMTAAALCSACTTHHPHSEELRAFELNSSHERTLLCAMRKAEKAYARMAELEDGLPETEPYSDESFYTAMNYWHDHRDAARSLREEIDVFVNKAIELLGEAKGTQLVRNFFSRLAREYGYSSRLSLFIHFGHPLVGMAGIEHSKGYIIKNSLRPTRDAVYQFALHQYQKNSGR